MSIKGILESAMRRRTFLKRTAAGCVGLGSTLSLGKSTKSTLASKAMAKPDSEACVIADGLSSLALAEAGPEPNAALADTWWPPQRNVWTPIGWPNHLFRFNVIYNGTVVAQPYPYEPREVTLPWKGEDLQLTFYLSSDKNNVHRPKPPYQLSGLSDRGLGRQGWVDRPTPVLWSEWSLYEMNTMGLSRAGLLVRKEIFAYILGAHEVETGIEPLYSWIRLSVSHVDELLTDDEIIITVDLTRVNIGKSMVHEGNLTVRRPSPYPSALEAEMFTIDAHDGFRILNEDDHVRLMGISAEADAFDFSEIEPDSGTYSLSVTLPARKGAFADLLLPMLAAERPAIETEFETGFEEALKQSDAYWAVEPSTAATIDTPEPWMNEAVKHSLKLGRVISEKNPDTGESSFLTGSWSYDVLWATPTSMVSHMMFDPLGYHALVEKHIELFRLNQGTVKPPGNIYESHPGYFSTPKSLTSVDWLCDHGAILYTVSRHALITNNQAFIDRWLPAIIKGCEFIKDSRAITGHEGVPGVLPPAVSTDLRIPSQSIWNVGWNHRGLRAAIKLLQRLNHPRASEFAAEAEAYRARFVEALDEAILDTPRWTDSQGNKRPIVPTCLADGEDIFHAFYLDTGPLFLVWSGVLTADTPAMKDTVSFFREGPNTKIYDPRHNCFQRPILIHEMSSSEPCYSWNVYHSWQLGDRYRYLEGMYSLLVGALSPQTYISHETRHGLSGLVAVNPLMIDLARLAVIDDQIAENELHLLRLAPQAWLKTDYLTRFEKIVTEFGPVSLHFKLDENGQTLDVTWSPAFHHTPDKVVLHIPPVEGLNQIRINGQSRETHPGSTLMLD